MRNGRSAATCAAPLAAAPAQPARAFRDRVGMVLDLDRGHIEQFMDCDGAGPAHVPMGLIDLRMEIRRRAEILV